MVRIALRRSSTLRVRSWAAARSVAVSLPVSAIAEKKEKMSNALNRGMMILRGIMGTPSLLKTVEDPLWKGGAAEHTEVMPISYIKIYETLTE